MGYTKGGRPERICYGEMQRILLSMKLMSFSIMLNIKMFEFFLRGGKGGGAGRQGVFLETLFTVYYLDHHLLSVVVI